MNRCCSVTSIALWFVFGLLCLLPSLSAAQVPQTIHYEGYLTDAAGTLINGPVNLVLRLYSTPAGGTAAWSETYSGVPVDQGRLTLELGSQAPFAANLFDVPLYLGITVGTDPEMSPRTPLKSVPFALKSEDAATVGGLTPAQVQVTGAQALAKLAPVDGTGSGLDADRLDGNDATAFAPASHAHANYVAKSGDTMTGSLVVDSSTAGPVLRGTGGGLSVSGTGPSWDAANSTWVPGGPGAFPGSGAGTRLQWYPEMGAFRVGEVTDVQWDEANTGAYSVAMGLNTMASGDFSTAMGWNTMASGDFSTAMGLGSTASGKYSTAMGTNSVASGYHARAMGEGTTASSYLETVIGVHNTTDPSATPDSWAPGDRLFVIGNGNAVRDSDALVVLKNGNTGIGTSAPATRLDVNGTVQATGLKLAASALKTYTASASNSATEVTTVTGQVSFCALTRVQYTTATTGTNKWCRVVPNGDGTWTLGARADAGQSQDCTATCF